jgi:hypothetical protein
VAGHKADSNIGNPTSKPNHLIDLASRHNAWIQSVPPESKPEHARTVDNDAS